MLAEIRKRTTGSSGGGDAFLEGGREPRMSSSIDLYWSFRSPYSYLVTERLVRLAAEYSLEIRVRPVYPLAVRDPGFFEEVNPPWIRYLLRDFRRLADYHGIDFGWPRPDPVVQNLETRRISEEQPYIHRLVRLGVEATLRGRGLPFVDGVSRIIWSGRTEGWNEGSHPADAASRAARFGRRAHSSCAGPVKKAGQA